MIAKRKMNARATDLYIDQLLNETPGKHRISMVKDVRIFVNTIDHAIRLMTDNGVPATSHREERDGYIESIRCAFRLRQHRNKENLHVFSAFFSRKRFKKRR